MAQPKYKLYSPFVQSAKVMTEQELNTRLTDYFSVVAPENAIDENLETYRRYVKKHGVLSLDRKLKKTLGYGLSEFGNTEEDWSRINRDLFRYYEKHKPTMPKDKVRKIGDFAKLYGLKKLDDRLKKKYGETFNSFCSMSLFAWKRRWRRTIEKRHKEQLTYELRRFYACVAFNEGIKEQDERSLAKLVEWGLEHSREEINERLLEKYKFCLDDIRMIPGNSNSERIQFLKVQLVEFYQHHDPMLIPEMNRAREKAKKAGDELNRTAERGIVSLEELNAQLKEKYRDELPDKSREGLRNALRRFYEQHDPYKSEEEIEKIIDHAFQEGVVNLNEKLVLKYGRGIDFTSIQLISLTN